MAAHALHAGFGTPKRPQGDHVEQAPILASMIVVLLCAFSSVYVARHSQPVPGYEFIVPAGL